MTPEEFPQWFAEVWALPKPEGFLERVMPMVADDALFIQPSYPDARTHDQIARVFRRLFTLIPDLVAVPRHHAVSGEVVFIESDCAGTLGRAPITFSVCDRFVIRDGKIAERRSFTDPTAVFTATLRRPSSWPRAVRSVR